MHLEGDQTRLDFYSVYKESLNKKRILKASTLTSEKIKEKKRFNAYHNQEPSDILFQDKSPIRKASTIGSSPTRLRNDAQTLVLRVIEKNVRFNIMKKRFSGEFDYNESPFTCVDINKWEFVIVCPNPNSFDLRDKIGIEDAKKIFKKSFRPQFSKNLKTLGENNYVEFKAFESLLGTNSMEANSENLGISNNNLEGISPNVNPQEIPKEYLTLMRNALLVKLGYHLGLHTKQIHSSNGKYIYILVCADEEILKDEAESDSYNLQLELGEIDLPSLEPVDDNWRPLRIVKHNNKDVKDKLKEFKKNYPDIFDYFKISENDENKYEPEGINDGMVITYLEYLAFLNEGFGEMNSFEFDPSSTKVYLKKLIQRSIVNANKNKKKEHQIFNMWSRLGFDKPISPYLEYFRKIDPDTGEYQYNHMWKNHETQSLDSKSIFSSIDRIKLLVKLIKRQVNLEYLVETKIIDCFFPLKNSFDLNGERKYNEILNDLPNHDLVKSKLKNKMGIEFYTPSQKGILNNWKSKIYDRKMPLTKIRNYFGEKIGFYFAFVSYYSKILFVPSLVGVIVFILQKIYDPGSSKIVIIDSLFCICVSVWASVFIEVWKRKEKCLAIKWGQTDFKEDEEYRPQFRGVAKRSPVDDELDDLYFNPIYRYMFYAVSLIVTGGFIVIAVVIALYLIQFRKKITNTLILNNFDMIGLLVSSINAIQIQILNQIFSKVAVKLTKLENHRTQTGYENSLILKTYVFQFVNSFFSLYYIAFFKSSIEGCFVITNDNSMKNVEGGSCVDELFIQFFAIFLISFFRKLYEIGKPYCQALKKSQEFKKVRQGVIDEENAIDKKRIEIDVQFSLPLYLNREVDGTLGDYLQIAVLFGYITLFAVAFPLSGFLAFLSILAEIKVDRYKLLNLVKRPIPYGAKDISTWKTIFMFNSFASIVTNSALICFALPTFEKYTVAEDKKYLIFSIFCLILLLLRTVVSMIIPNIPLKYKIISKRHSKIAQSFIKGWEVSDSRNRSSQVYVNPEIY